MNEPKKIKPADLVKAIRAIPKEVWIADANAITQALESHPDRGPIAYRLGLLHSISALDV